MITVEVNGERVNIVPRSLQDYCQKTDYIRSRRPTPAQLLAGMLTPKNPEANAKVTELVINQFMRGGSVSFEEEMSFDVSFEGFFHSLWQGAKESVKGWDRLKAEAGVQAAKVWFEQLDTEKQTEVRLALRGVDQRALSKNSDGLPETTEEAKSQETSSA